MKSSTRFWAVTFGVALLAAGIGIWYVLSKNASPENFAGAAEPKAAPGAPAAGQYRSQFPIPSSGNDSFGVNLDDTTAITAGEQSKMADMGVKWVRVDFKWADIEKSRGRADFSKIDHLLSSLPRGVRVVGCLDYNNHLYGSSDQAAVVSSANQDAYVRYCITAIGRYKGEGILWEFWNEPEYTFKGGSASDFARMTERAASAARKQFPDEYLAAGGLAQFNYDWVSALGSAGVFDQVDYCTVHGYRREETPETVLPDFAKLRSAIDRFHPKRTIYIGMSEWGYSDLEVKKSTRTAQIDTQADLTVRLVKATQRAGARLCIVYRWRDWADKYNMKDKNQHYGMLDVNGNPKPVYYALKKLLNP